MAVSNFMQRIKRGIATKYLSGNQGSSSKVPSSAVSVLCCGDSGVVCVVPNLTLLSGTSYKNIYDCKLQL